MSKSLFKDTYGMTEEEFANRYGHRIAGSLSQAYNRYLATSYLPCGCYKECDPYAHDTAWDWDGTPDGPGYNDLSQEEQAKYKAEYKELYGEEYQDGRE